MIGRAEREGRRTNAKLQLWSLPHGVFGMWSIEDGEQPRPQSVAREGMHPHSKGLKESRQLVMNNSGTR
jgi:hypothetical protein